MPFYASCINTHIQCDLPVSQTETNVFGNALKFGFHECHNFKINIAHGHHHCESRINMTIFSQQLPTNIATLGRHSVSTNVLSGNHGSEHDFKF